MDVFKLLAGVAPSLEITCQGAGKKVLRPIVKPIQKDNLVFFLVVEWSAFFFSSQWTEASRESAYPVYMCFVNLEKAYNQVP